MFFFVCPYSPDIPYRNTNTNAYPLKIAHSVHNSFAKGQSMVIAAILAFSPLLFQKSQLYISGRLNLKYGIAFLIKAISERSTIVDTSAGPDASGPC